MALDLISHFNDMALLIQQAVDKNDKEKAEQLIRLCAGVFSQVFNQQLDRIPTEFKAEAKLVARQQFEAIINLFKSLLNPSKRPDTSEFQSKMAQSLNIFDSILTPHKADAPHLKKNLTSILLKKKQLSREIEQVAKKVDSLFDQHLAEMGIRLRLAELRGCAAAQVTEADIQKQLKEDEVAAETKRQKALQELLREEKETKEAPKKSQKPQKAQQKKKEAAAETPQLAAPTLPPTKEELRHRYLMELVARPSLKEHSRVTERWKAKDLEKIRQFEDRLSTGERVKHYAELTDEELAFARACHLLPGAEKIFADPLDRRTYTFPIPRGLGMVVRLEFEQKNEYRVLYFGIGADNCIFHRYAEPIEVQKLSSALGYEPPKIQTLSQETEEPWEGVSRFIPDLSKEGVISFNYPGEKHRLHVYPIRKDLLREELY